MLLGVVLRGAAFAVAPDFNNDPLFLLPLLPHINGHSGSQEDGKLWSTISKIVPPHTLQGFWGVAAWRNQFFFGGVMGTPQRLPKNRIRTCMLGKAIKPGQ